MLVLTAEMEPLGHLPFHWKAEPAGVSQGVVAEGAAAIDVTYLGPSDFFRKG
jgi:hypothetical protein